MLDGVVRAAGEALEAREVVGQERVLRVGVDDRPQAIDHGLVLARLVLGPNRRPELPADRLVRLPRDPADRDDRRPGLLGERRALHARRGVHERSGRCGDPFAVQLERSAPALDEVELLAPVVRVRLVVLVEDPVAHLAARPRVHAERGDAEVVPDWAIGLAPVVELVDLVEVRDLIATHVSSSASSSPAAAAVESTDHRARRAGRAGLTCRSSRRRRRG